MFLMIQNEVLTPRGSDLRLVESFKLTSGLKICQPAAAFELGDSLPRNALVQVYPLTFAYWRLY